MGMKEVIFFICGIIIGSIWSFIIYRSVSRNKIIELNTTKSEIIKFHKERKFYNFTEAELGSLYFILSNHINFPNISNIIRDLNNEFKERDIDPINIPEYFVCSKMYSYKAYTNKDLYRQKRKIVSLVHFLEHVLKNKENQYNKDDYNESNFDILNKNFGNIASDDDTIRILKESNERDIGNMIRFYQDRIHNINNELKLRRNY